ncbi:Protein of unknown function [Haloechinothrix alba]|uniref:Copper(I)-binding protein n=1 Tax=Haloechinothrix alba TaxID=664784 RepID=A0A238XS10_9PSEU|nr:copper chaperone PCu(A)C [Haloechinothrix alba]SNR61482.1 Protein of unknown function [Haloechinothrix alba]
MGQHNNRLFGSRLAVRAGLACGSALLLAGCGAGQITQTDSQLPAVDGGGARTDSIVVSNATLAFPEGEDQHHYAGGSDAPVNMHIANRSDEPDELVSVSTDVASDVTIEGDPTVLNSGELFIVEPGQLEEGEDSVLVAGESGLLRQQAAVVLNDLEHPVRPAQSVTLTLTFREAGTIEVLAPIAPSPHDRVVEVADDEEGGGGH